MKRALFTIITVLIGVIVVAGSALWLYAIQKPSPAYAATVVGTANTPQGVVKHATMTLDIHPNGGPSVPNPPGVPASEVDAGGWPFYSQTSLQFPAHTLVTITVHQYDGASTVWNPYFAGVHGTVGNTAVFNGKSASSINPANVAHTFTIHQYPQANQPYFFVSVPMLAVPNNAKNLANGFPAPQTITFSFMTGAPGKYMWNCEDPCGNSYQDFGGVMSQHGYMSGTVTVV